MKKTMFKKMLFTMILLGSILTLNAQSGLYISGGATAVRKIIVPSGDIGVQFNKNTLSFNVQTYDHSRRAVRLVNCRPELYKKEFPREWVYSVRYSRIIPIVKPLDILPNITVGVAKDGHDRFATSAGVSLRLNISKRVHLQTITQFPILRNYSGEFKYKSVQNGLLLTYYLVI